MKKSKSSSRFRKDYKKLKKSGRYDLNKLHKVLRMIEKEEHLDEKYKDHSLEGEWKNCRDCHIEGDCVLIYEITEDCIIFHRTGTHSELFG